VNTFSQSSAGLCAVKLLLSAFPSFCTSGWEEVIKCSPYSREGIMCHSCGTSCPHYLSVFSIRYLPPHPHLFIYSLTNINVDSGILIYYFEIWSKVWLYFVVQIVPILAAWSIVSWILCPFDFVGVFGAFSYFLTLSDAPGLFCPRISLCSQESWFLLLQTDITNQDLSIRCVVFFERRDTVYRSSSLVKWLKFFWKIISFCKVLNLTSICLYKEFKMPF
jgi:hypothetical protein